MNLKTLTLEQKVGQLFLLGHSDLNISGELINLITKYHIGGIAYSGNQRQNAKKLAHFSNTIQKYSGKQTPLFISISEYSTHSIDEMTNLPNKLSLGALDNRLYSKRIAGVVGKQLHNLGINMIFSPNLNLYKNESTNQYTLFPFGENVNKVKKHASDMIHGFKNEKVIPILNYFPTIEDNGHSHPISDHSLLPFMYAIQQGADVLMISHVENASISSEIIREGLRKKIGYDGLIMTDNIEKLTENNEYELNDAIILALKAGVDIIYLNSSLQNQQTAIDAVIRAVKTGELKEEDIDESIRRILHVKNKYELSELPTFNHELVAKNKHIEFAKKLNEQSVTIVKNEQQMIPLNRKLETIILTPPTKMNKSTPSVQWEFFNNFFYDELENFTTLPLDMDEELFHTCEKAEQMIIPISYITESKQTLQLINEILQQYSHKIIICAFGHPFDLLEIQNASTLLLTYDTSRMSMQAMAKVILNKNRTRAKLPLHLSDEWKIGHQAK